MYNFQYIILMQMCTTSWIMFKANEMMMNFTISKGLLNSLRYFLNPFISCHVINPVAVVCVCNFIHGWKEFLLSGRLKRCMGNRSFFFAFGPKAGGWNNKKKTVKELKHEGWCIMGITYIRLRRNGVNWIHIVSISLCIFNLSKFVGEGFFKFSGLAGGKKGENWRERFRRLKKRVP